MLVRTPVEQLCMVHSSINLLDAALELIRCLKQAYLRFFFLWSTLVAGGEKLLADGQGDWVTWVKDCKNI